MEYIILGIIGFFLFFLYDWNSIAGNYRFPKLFFGAGCLCVSCSSAGLVIRAVGTAGIGVIRGCVFLTGAAVFFLLLIYALFFALPFKNTYVQEIVPREEFSDCGEPRKRQLPPDRPHVCRRGVYAMCRHPGVLMFIGLFVCLCAAVPDRLLIMGSAVLCALNLLYIIFQDRVSFPKSFCDYEEYKKTVPFLIPTGRSMKECISTLADRREKDR